MSAERVKSKNLFNFRPAGVVDADILAYEKQLEAEMGGDPDEMMDQFNAMPDEDFVGAMRGMIDGYSEGESYFNHPIVNEAAESCNHTELSVPTTHCEEYDVQVLVHTPKAVSGEPNLPCIVYAHGGGAVACTAGQYKPYLSYMAVDCGVVVFNVDYRLAPETRSPNNVLDFYEVVKYVSQNAADLGVDPARICIAGESGGGYICAGAMVQLAKEGESDLVKLAVPIIPMLSRYCFSDKAAMTKPEAKQADGQKRIWGLIAGPEIDSMHEDALLFPGHADDETLAQMPPTIVWSSEFDFYQTESMRFANRVRAAGRLLELVVIPGTTHGSGMQPMLGCFKVEREAFRVAIQEYLVKQED